MPNVTNFTAKTEGAEVNGTLTDNLPIKPVSGKAGRIAIGPRVTFNFITTQWNKGNSYQYYDVVQVSGNSYIARQNVPAGIDITDTNYWVHWADPNAQFTELYNIVMGFESRLESMEQTVTTLKDGSTYEDMTDNGFAYLGKGE